jgi:hypothetical protein
MAFKDIPGLGWTVILVLAMLMGWGVLKYYTGMPGFPDELKRAISHLIGADKDDGHAPAKGN